MSLDREYHSHVSLTLHNLTPPSRFAKLCVAYRMGTNIPQFVRDMYRMLRSDHCDALDI